MKTYFETPDLDVVKLSVNDIITASPEPPVPGEDELPPIPVS